MNIDNYIWHSALPFQQRYDKSSSALIAIAETLSENPQTTDNTTLFLSSYERFIDFNEDTIEQVWRDPVAYFWVRLCYQLLSNIMTGAPLSQNGQAYVNSLNVSSNTEALAIHLRKFQIFVLSAAYLDSSSENFNTPITGHSPLLLPGTNLVIYSKNEINISTITNGTIRITCDGTDREISLRKDNQINGVSIQRTLAAEHEGFHLPVTEAGHNNLPGLNFTAPMLDIDKGYQQKHLSLVAETLGLIAEYLPECYHHITSILKRIAIKPASSGDYTNISYSDLPGTFVASIYENPYEMADTFIHEFHHDRLFFLEEQGSFFDHDKQDTLSDFSYYSPWRDDLRPLHGIYHALYVHIPVCWFWDNVLEKRTAPELILEYANERLIRYIYMLKLGIEEIKCHAYLTDYGQDIFEQIILDIGVLDEKMMQSKFDLDPLALQCQVNGDIIHELNKKSRITQSVKEAVKQHVMLIASCEDKERLLAVI